MPLILTARAQYKEISLDFDDMNITFIEADTAEVILADSAGMALLAIVQA